MALQVVQGFSLTNRWLLYASFMLAPAQHISGLGNNCPNNIGFLVYSWYSQVTWYSAVKDKQMHALSLILPHVNIVFAFTYLGGVSSGNIVLGILLGLGTAGVIVLNTVSAWTSWAVHQPDGFGVYQFFFFGWRTLDEGWHKFFLLWQIGDSLFAFGAVVGAVYGAVDAALEEDQEGYPYGLRCFAIPLGAAFMLILGWPLILWTELIMSRNDLESDTDMVAVWYVLLYFASSLGRYGRLRER